MRILFVTGEFPPMQGGVGDYTRELALALVDQGCQVHVVSSAQAGSVDGLVVHPVIEKWNWASWRHLVDLVRRHEPDIVHVQYQAAAYGMHPAVNLLPRRLVWLGPGRPRTIVTFHDLRVPYLFPKAGPLRRCVVEDLARRSDAAITTNQEDFESLRQGIGKAPALIPIGSNIAPRLPDSFDRHAWRARWGIDPDDLLLCFFGFVNDRKGVDTLLRALQILVAEKAQAGETRLLMIGGQTGASDPTNVAYLDKIRTLIADLGLADHILWTGFVPKEEVSASFAAADVCVLPYRDGVSFLHGTLHAALVHGVPIITTHPRVALPELESGETVMLVPPDAPKDLAGAIRRLEASPRLRDTLAAGALELSSQFRWSKIAADTLELYLSVDARA